MNEDDYKEQVSAVRKSIEIALIRGLNDTIPQLVANIGHEGAGAVTYANAAVILVDALATMMVMSNSCTNPDQLKTAVLGTFNRALAGFAANDISLEDIRNMQ